MEFPLIPTLLRLLIPLLILRFPLPGIILTMLTDMYDWQMIKPRTAAETDYYQGWDKALDVYYQCFILVIVFRFKDIIAKRIALILFSYRLLGLLIFSLTHSRYFLLIFPNFFENLVVFYLFYVSFTKQKILFTSVRRTSLILAFLIIPKLIHEYFQHVLIKQPWEIYNIGKALGATGIVEEYCNYLFWGGIFYLIPAWIIFVLLKRKRL